MTVFTDEELISLREEVKHRQNEKRFSHTCGVEAEAAWIGAIYMPEHISELRAAALLHDLTKCIPDEEQIPLCESLGIALSDIERATPQVLHGRSAEVVIMRDFPQFATPEILRAVRVHTTGDAQMTTFDKIIFLSDYIEAGRPYDDCKRMREKFHSFCDKYGASPGHLDMVLCEIFLFTLHFLKKHNIPIAPGTMQAYLALGGDEKEV